MIVNNGFAAGQVVRVEEHMNFGSDLNAGGVSEFQEDKAKDSGFRELVSNALSKKVYNDFCIVQPS